MYRDLNDYEILYMVSENNDIFNILYYKYQPLIYKLVKDYTKFFKKFGYEIDDLMQIGYLTLYKASYLYNVYSDSMFYTYLQKAILNAIYYEIRTNSTLKREVLNNALSYDKEIPNSDIKYIDLMSNPEGQKINEQTLIIFKNSMPFEMGNVFEMFKNGYSQEEISILLDHDIKTVSSYLKKIKQHALTYKGLFFQ